MTRRLTVALAATAALGVSALGVSTATAAKKNTITVKGGVEFKAGEFVKDTLRFTPRVLTVKSGATVRVVDKAQEAAPHTVSLVRKRDLPTGFSPQQCPQCGPLTEAHQANEETGEVGIPLVNAGAEGFDVPGDSIFMPPEQSVSFKVTAAKGKNLYYFCVVHPWMQGQIKVG
jgi:plastocyanin